MATSRKPMTKSSASAAVAVVVRGFADPRDNLDEWEGDTDIAEAHAHAPPSPTRPRPPRMGGLRVMAPVPKTGDTESLVFATLTDVDHYRRQRAPARLEERVSDLATRLYPDLTTLNADLQPAGRRHAEEVSRLEARLADHEAETARMEAHALPVLLLGVILGAADGALAALPVWLGAGTTGLVAALSLWMALRVCRVHSRRGPDVLSPCFSKAGAFAPPKWPR